MKQLYSHLAVHPQSIAVPHARVLRFKPSSVGYISDNKSCWERKGGPKSRRSCSSSLRSRISEEHCARRMCWGMESCLGTVSTALTVHCPRGATKRLLARVAMAQLCKEIRGGSGSLLC